MQRQSLVADHVSPPREEQRSRITGQKIYRTMVQVHLWIGVLFSAVLLVISITGILLNHKTELGLMPDVSSKPTADFPQALPLPELSRIALEAAGETKGVAAIDRMDVRPKKGLVKVRLRDPSTTEVTVDIYTGKVLHTGARSDVFMEKLHSGELLGDRWILLSDAGAAICILLILTGYWQWIWPRLRK